MTQKQQSQKPNECGDNEGIKQSPKKVDNEQFTSAGRQFQKQTKSNGRNAPSKENDDDLAADEASAESFHASDPPARNVSRT